VAHFPDFLGDGQLPAFAYFRLTAPLSFHGPPPGQFLNSEYQKFVELYIGKMSNKNIPSPSPPPIELWRIKFFLA
jgi:hypothetical protein